jgi:hypothetical protein
MPAAVTPYTSGYGDAGGGEHADQPTRWGRGWRQLIEEVESHEETCPFNTAPSLVSTSSDGVDSASGLTPSMPAVYP